MKTKEKVAICWFRQDLRLFDNPALTQASTHNSVLPIYILDDENAKAYAMGAASRWWLHHSLLSLKSSLDGNLSFYQGQPLKIIQSLLDKYDVEAIYWNRCYEPWQMARDTALKACLKSENILVKSFNASLLWEPNSIKKTDGTPFKVFTPFYRKGCLQSVAPRKPLATPTITKPVFDKQSVDIYELALLPKKDWGKVLQPHWQIGEKGAEKRFNAFIKEGLFCYKEGRNIPSKPYVSRLSPYLHFGEISPNQLWYTVRNIADDNNVDHFCSELGWREFSYNLLFHHPELPKKNLQAKFDHFPWVNDAKCLKAWQQGRTGIPMVDAGMRQLWQTGFIHNRVRMIVGSFLVKNLRLHWHHGERWFWDTLVDADLANNSASWQWIAGCGADAAPYFRVFNPVTQGEKFDPEGDYVRQYLPELAKLPNKYLFQPWNAPKEVLEKANVELGVDYPNPIVDLKFSREAALQAFQSLKR